jgi:hypothetical protein
MLKACAKTTPHSRWNANIFLRQFFGVVRTLNPSEMIMNKAQALKE